MNIVLLKGQGSIIDIKAQQQAIIKYAKSNSLSLDHTEIEGSIDGYVLEERKEFKGFLRSLNVDDHILIYDLHTLSSDVGELVKVFDCFFGRSITLHIASKNSSLCSETNALDVLQVLSKFREDIIHSDEKKTQGRPKGRMSKSKFDTHRNAIIDLLAQGASVSKVAKTLHVSRTSLKDYINSRGLKDLVKAKLTLLGNKGVQTFKPVVKENKEKLNECSLIKE